MICCHVNFLCEKRTLNPIKRGPGLTASFNISPSPSDLVNRQMSISHLTFYLPLLYSYLFGNSLMEEHSSTTSFGWIQETVYTHQYTISNDYHFKIYRFQVLKFAALECYQWSFINHSENIYQQNISTKNNNINNNINLGSRHAKLLLSQFPSFSTVTQKAVKI